ncbi:MAG: pantoate--beta-alanine ligase [Bacteroidales bacterium]
MKQFTSIDTIKSHIKALKEAGKVIGFVPTMGALHQGHLDLVTRSKKENDITVCSIFVNPIQFNNREDLAKYPRTPDEDAILLEKSGCDVLFSPTATEMYPENDPVSIELEFGFLDKVMEGKFRPGHFNGVAIVVKKFFDIVLPDNAYFGKKDYQQLAIIRFMVNALGMPLKIIPCETVRDADGLALSSRNARLTPAERRVAPVIYQVLRSVVRQAGVLPVSKLRERAIKNIEEHPGFRVEYLEIGDKESLLPLENWEHMDRAVVFVAVFLGDVRLIDNIELFL